MRRRLLTMLTSILVGAAVFSAAPARAESGDRAKEVGNAPASIDISHIYANNAQNRVKVKLVVPGLSDKGIFTIGYEGVYYDGMAIVIRHRDSGVTWQAWHCGQDFCDKVKCSGAKVRWKDEKNYIRAAVPQSCYPSRVPKAWNFDGLSQLGKAYDIEDTKLRLRRG